MAKVRPAILAQSGNASGQGSARRGTLGGVRALERVSRTLRPSNAPAVLCGSRIRHFAQRLRDADAVRSDAINEMHDQGEMPWLAAMRFREPHSMQATAARVPCGIPNAVPLRRPRCGIGASELDHPVLTGLHDTDIGAKRPPNAEFGAPNAVQFISAHLRGISRSWKLRSRGFGILQ